MTTQEILLKFGEMSAPELRTAHAIVAHFERTTIPREVADRLRDALMSVRPYSRNVAEIVDAALDAYDTNMKP